jgi:hypothetical protein
MEKIQNYKTDSTMLQLSTVWPFLCILWSPSQMCQVRQVTCYARLSKAPVRPTEMLQLWWRTPGQLLGMPGIQEDPRTQEPPIAPSEISALISASYTVVHRQTPTWAQVAAHSPGIQEDQSLPSVIGSLKSIFSSLNLQTISVALRTLATRLHDARDTMDKMMLLFDTIMACFTTSP